jgi:hypothetical protein
MSLYDDDERATFIEKGLKVYDSLAAELEKEHPGEIIAINPETGEYHVGKTLNRADALAYEARRDGWYLFVRIGDRSSHLPLQSW